MSQLIERKSQQYEQLLSGLQKKDPRLYDLLKLLSKDVTGLMDVVDPIQASIARIESGALDSPPGPTSFIAVTSPTAVTFVYSSSDPKVAFYEIRRGPTWDTAVFVIRTPSLTASINPLITGTHKFWLKTLSSTLVPSKDALFVDVVIPPIGTPSVAASVVDNNVLLSWSIPDSTFAIDHYNVYKDGIKFATLNGTFIARFEAASGTFTYQVEAVDIAGSVSAQGSATATVRQPPDYILQDQRTLDLSTMTLTNCVYDVTTGKIIACIDTAETFENHFLSRLWATPQAQVNAGYERWIQDNLLIGSAVDTYDYGTVFSNIIVTIDWVKENYSGTSDVTVTVKMATKVDAADPWSPETIGASQFFGTFRYLRITLEFTAPNDDSMIAISNVSSNVSVKREVDSGSVMALLTDPDGTLVFFNKTFKDIDSLTATSESRTPITVITIFEDIPNPISFRVMAFDSAGRRVTYTVDWKARGIV